MRRQPLRQRPQRDAGLDGEREVGRLVLDHAIERRQVERHVVARERRAHCERGAPRLRHDGEPAAIGRGQRRRHLVAVEGRERHGGPPPLDRVACGIALAAGR